MLYIHIQIWARAIRRRFYNGLIGTNRDPAGHLSFPAFPLEVLLFFMFLALSGLVGGRRPGRAQYKRDAPICSYCTGKLLKYAGPAPKK